MSTQRRHLVQRTRNPDQSSPAPRSQHRGAATPAPERTELPPYEPPSCPLSDDARGKLENLRIESGTLKYKKHLATVVSALQVATPECHERVFYRKEQMGKLDARRKNKEDDEDLAKEYDDLERYTSGLNKQVEKHTKDADKALRDLIDYGDELTMQDTMMKEVIETMTAAAAAQVPSRPRRRRDEDEDEDESEDVPVDDAEVLSILELLQNSKEDYTATYEARTMRARYAENNDYKRFKQGIHEAANQGDSAPVMPHARTWFPEEQGQNIGSSSHRRHNNTTDNTNNNDEDEDDDDIQIAGVTDVLKCPLTLKYFEQPYSNSVCRHIFEKSAIIEYINSQGTIYVTGTQTGGPRVGVKQAKCPQAGCEQMLSLNDFQDDPLTLRKVLRKQKSEREEAQQDEDSDDDAPRGTQRNRPERIDDEDSDGVDVDAADYSAKRAREIARIKRERHQSNGPSRAPRHPRASDPHVIDMGED